MGNGNLAGIDFGKFLTRLGHRLKALHIHDNDGVGDLHHIPFTFTKTRENIRIGRDSSGGLGGLGMRVC